MSHRRLVQIAQRSPWPPCFLRHATAGSITYEATAPGGNAAAVATFSTFAGGITVTLVNNDVNPTSVAENVSALVFDVSTGNGGAGSSLSSSSGLERTVAGNGSFSDGALVNTGWVIGTSGSSIISLDVLSGSGHAGPAHTLIGNPDSSDSYSNANGSTPATDPTIPSSRTRSRSTSPILRPQPKHDHERQLPVRPTDGSNLVRGIDPPSLAVPEPASLGMAGIGLASVFGYCVFGRRRRERLKTAC